MQLQFDVDPNNLAVVQAYNAGTAKVDGAELEILWSPVNDLTLGLDYTYLHTSIDEVTAIAGTIFDPAVNPLSPYKVGDNVAPVFRLPYAPQDILNATADWTMFHTRGGSLELALNYRYQGRQYDTAPTGPAVPGSTEFYSIPGHGVLDGKLRWNFNLADSKKTMNVSVWGKNLTDKTYQAHVIGQGPIIPVLTAQGPEPVAGYTYQAIAWAPQLMWGVEFQYGF